MKGVPIATAAAGGPVAGPSQPAPERGASCSGTCPSRLISRPDRCRFGLRWLLGSGRPVVSSPSAPSSSSAVIGAASSSAPNSAVLCILAVYVALPPAARGSRRVRWRLGPLGGAAACSVAPRRARGRKIGTSGRIPEPDYGFRTETTITAGAGWVRQEHQGGRHPPAVDGPFLHRAATQRC